MGRPNERTGKQAFVGRASVRVHLHVGVGVGAIAMNVAVLAEVASLVT